MAAHEPPRRPPLSAARSDLARSAPAGVAPHGAAQAGTVPADVAAPTPAGPMAPDAIAPALPGADLPLPNPPLPEHAAADVITPARAPRGVWGALSGAAAHCFLCAYTTEPCDVPVLDGVLLGVAERWRGGDRPVLLVATPPGERVAVVLEPRDRPLARDLARLTPEQRHALHLRVYHLRAPVPGAPVPAGSAPAAAPDAPADGAPADAAPGDPRPDGHGRYRTLRTTAASTVVLEPDLLLNITDINHAEYCVRQYILRRVVPSPPTAATLRGTIIHGAFKELLKGRAGEPAALLDQALRAQATDLALQDLPADVVAADAEPHLRALVRWYDSERQVLWRRAPAIRVETFVLAPDVGLKGRLDALWEDEHTSRLLELKTSTVRGDLPRREHRWQVYGYQTLLAARRPHRDDRRPAATLLYSGTPGQAEAHTLPFSLRELHRVLELRNALAIAHATGAVPDPPGERKCARCAIHRDCARAAPLLGWTPPPVEDTPAPESGADVAWFGRYHDLLALEGRAAEALARTLWTTSPEQRRAAGTALTALEPVGEPSETASGEWEYTFRCANLSELRDGDPVLLSDGDPIHGAAVTGTVLRITDREVVVWTPERIAGPRLLDRYAADIVHDRTVRNLWRWLDADPRLRALVRGELAPTFGEDVRDAVDAGATDDQDLPGRTDFNPGQRQAVARALAARDFLLVQGPPGTGKTRVVAEIIQRAVARGERVLVAAFTNQAVDNVLRRLLAEGYHDFVRLGHRQSVAAEIQPYRLAERAAARSASVGQGGVSTAAADGGEDVDPGHLREVLAGAPVVASTTATWASEHYDGAGTALAFDLAVVDEASQLTVPALVGALRFSPRFVLVGDERQLPPLVVSPEAAAGGLGRSLFADLLARWGETASVALTAQYRMHPTICAFPSREFYDSRLITAGHAREALLAVAAEDRPPAPFDPARPVVFLDVGPEEAHNGIGVDPARAPGGEKASRAQAEVAARVVLGLRARGVAAERIGVVAPYRAQVAAIRQRLAAAGETTVVVDTVDRFQGGEREVVVLAFGPDPARVAHPAGTLAAGAPFVADAHRLNVALTRAQRKLILIGDRAALARVPVLGRLVAHCGALYGGRGGIARVSGPST